MSCLLVSFSARHTLWRCLQSTVTPILASILEVVDRYANMDLLSDERLSPGLRKLWLDILADPQILDLLSAQNTRYCKKLLLHNSNSKSYQQQAYFIFNYYML